MIVLKCKQVEIKILFQIVITYYFDFNQFSSQFASHLNFMNDDEYQLDDKYAFS